MKLSYRGTNYTTELTATSNTSQCLITTQYRGIEQLVLAPTQRVGVQISHPLTYRGTAYTGLCQSS